MSSLLTTLIDVIRLSASCSEHQGALKVAPAHAILADICAPHLPPAEIDQLADALVACAEGRSDALPNLDAIELALAGAEVETKLARASLALNELLALNYALRAGTDRLARLDISGAHFFDYLQELYFNPGPGQPTIVLIGAWLPAQEEVKVRLDPDHRLLKRIAISYSRNSPYPYLNLQLWSKSKTMPTRGDRQDYQKDNSANNLNLWTRDNKIKGEICTRLITTPYPIGGGHINMHFDDIPGLNLRETSILDDRGNTLVKCLRAIQQTTNLRREPKDQS